MKKPVCIQDINEMFDFILGWIDDNPQVDVSYFYQILSNSTFLTKYVNRVIARKKYENQSASK